jgi:putative ABC transport system permease protein
MMRRVSVRVAELVFGWLLRLLPRSTRAEYGAEIRADFSALAGAGGSSPSSVLVRSVADLIGSLPREWQNAGRPRGVMTSRNERMTMGERVGLMVQEFGQAARSLSKRPGFSLVATLTLALGIGANVAIFAVVNAILIRPLPYPEAERIVSIRHHAPGLNLEEMGNSAGTLSLYRDHARTFSAIAGTVNESRNLTGSGDAARVEIVRATPTIFDVLAVRPSLGRAFTDADAEAGAAPVAIITYEGWTQYFGRANDVLSRTVELNGVRTAIIGVMPKGFRYREDATVLLLPMKIDMREGFGSFGTEGLARVADGATLESARAEIVSLQAKIPELFPDVTAKFLSDAQWRVSVETMRDRMVEETEQTLWIVLGTVGFLLLVACASVANLFLVRAESRQREIGVRIALGATRARVAASFLYESALLGLAGGLWGLVLGSIAVRMLVATGPEQLPRLEEVSIDGTVLLFAAAVSIVAALFLGALPLLRSASRPVMNLASEGRATTAGRDRQRLRKTLIVAQIALAIVLLTGSGLMLKSFQRLRAVDTGIDPEGVLTMGISLGERIAKPVAARQYQEIIDAVKSVGGVEVAGMTNSLPLDPTGYNGSSYYMESRPRADDALPPVAMYAAISEGFMETMRTRLVAGRNIERADHEHGRHIVVINEQFAKTAFDGDALGERIRFADDSIWHEIVGVVANIRTFGIREDIREMAYLPMTTNVTGARLGLMTLVLRTSGDPASLTNSVREAVKRTAPNVPLISARTMEDVVNESLVDTSFTMTILVIAGVVALLLGAVGLYGVIGYVVSQRTREIGLRMALGAVPGQVRSMVMSQGLTLSLAGTAIGLLGATALTRVLESLLYEVDSRDPVTFIAVPVMLLAVSAVAAYVPARRASSIAPLEALRAE